MLGTLFGPAAPRAALLLHLMLLDAAGLHQLVDCQLLHSDPGMPVGLGLHGAGPISLRNTPTAAEAGLHWRRRLG